MTGHGDDEALSAFVDGEAPEWAAHVEACASCQKTVEALQMVRAVLAIPPRPGSAMERDRAVAIAVAAGLPEAAAPTSRRAVRWMVPASIAAVLLFIVGAASVLVQGRSSGNRATVAAQAPAPVESTKVGPAAGQAGGGAAGAAAAAGPAASDLGEIPDATTLVARARPGLVPRDAATAPVGPSAGPSGGGASNVVGTRPCEEQARATDPSLREVVYFATATHLAVPSVVLAFSTGAAPAPVTLLMLAQRGCAVLLRAAGP